MRRSVLPALLLLLPASPGRAQQDTSWQVYLDRTATVGARYAMTSSGNQVRRNQSSMPSQAPENSVNALEVHYAATHEVLAVGKNGLPSRMKLTIDRLETNDGSGPKDQFPPGTVIEAKAVGNETLFFQDRDELEGTLSDALNLAGANLGSVNEPSEDDVFKNHSPQRPGNKLKADPKLLARAISLTTPFRVDNTGSSAEMLFDRPAVENEVPALITEATYNIVLRGFKSSAGQPLKDSFIRSKTMRILPIDPSLPLVRESLETEMRLSNREEKEEADRTGDETPGFTTRFQRRATRDYRPLPSASTAPPAPAAAHVVPASPVPSPAAQTAESKP